jgi:hypothetical protein
MPSYYLEIRIPFGVKQAKEGKQRPQRDPISILKNMANRIIERQGEGISEYNQMYSTRQGREKIKKSLPFQGIVSPGNR